jgi:hypothetical protein
MPARDPEPVQDSSASSKETRRMARWRLQQLLLLRMLRLDPMLETAAALVPIGPRRLLRRIQAPCVDL